ncbi:hypothetical protein UlMin_000311 [Ulmus minor]
MSGNDCGQQKLLRPILIAIAGLIILIVIVIVVIWAILQPKKPRFILHDVTIYNFTTSAGPPCTLTSNIHVTISSDNPNYLIGIYYRELDVYATSRKQQITATTLLNGTYQGRYETVMWSSFLVGSAVPIPPYFHKDLNRELYSSTPVLIDVQIDGRIRWKVGSWISGDYHLHVYCQAFILLPKFKGFQHCDVET